MKTTIKLLERYIYITLIFFLLFSVSYGLGYASAGTISNDIPLSLLNAEEILDYSGSPTLVLHENIPDFYLSHLIPEAFVSFSPLDEYGRTGTGYACLGRETLPTSSREMIGNIQPSGWHTIRYDDLIEDRYLYNRSHVIGFLLSGDSATPENLFTGTRYLNATSMLQYEIQVVNYIEHTGNHVLYRVSPCYRGNDLVPFGVQLEAYSIEDQGNGVCFNVFLYNIQPGILINYRNGDSQRAPMLESSSDSMFHLEEVDNPAEPPGPENRISEKTDTTAEKEVTYVFNKNSKKFHYPYCSNVTEMKPQNRENFYGTKEQALALGYKPCGSCRP